jgi:hypothetical protein
MPLDHQGMPAGRLHGAVQTWHILEVRDQWSHPAPAAAGRGHEIQRWLLLVDGPPVYDAGESWVREVIVSAFAEDGTWWMDVS